MGWKTEYIYECIIHLCKKIICKCFYVIFSRLNWIVLLYCLLTNSLQHMFVCMWYCCFTSVSLPTQSGCLTSDLHSVFLCLSLYDIHLGHIYIAWPASQLLKCIVLYLVMEKSLFFSAFLSKMSISKSFIWGYGSAVV